MKKAFIFVLCSFLALTLSSCDIITSIPENNQIPIISNENSDKTSPPEHEHEDVPEISFNKLMSDWQVYENATELITAADTVFIARITDISFGVLNSKTAMPADKDTEAFNRYLYTLYKIDIMDVYKGDPSNATHIKVPGGLEGYNEKQQYDRLKAYGMADGDVSIPMTVTSSYKPIDIKMGGVYLFTLDYSPNPKYLTILCPDQTFYSLDDPSKGKGIHDIRISAEDIISKFGRNKLDSFLSEWQNGEYTYIAPPSDEEITAVANAIFKKEFGFDDLSKFSVNIYRLSYDKIHVSYTLQVCGMTTQESYELAFSELLVHTDTHARHKGEISRYLKTDGFLEAINTAKYKVYSACEKHGEPYAYIDLDSEGYLCVQSEIIVDINPPKLDEYGNEMSGCGYDHEHLFFTERVCNPSGEIIKTNSNLKQFSYEAAADMYREGDAGVNTSDFSNKNASSIEDQHSAIRRAVLECTIQYNEVNVYYDSHTGMWMVLFSTTDVDGGCQSVYMDQNGITHLIVYGE